MATSSLSRDFIITDPKSVDKIIYALEHPLEVKLDEVDVEEEKKDKERILCKISEQLASLK